MTQGERLTEAPANIVFPVDFDLDRVAREIGEHLLRPFEVDLARTVIRARADSFWNAVDPVTLSVTAVAVDGTLITRFCTSAPWPHRQQAVTLLEKAVASRQVKWEGNTASFTLSLQDAPELPGVFRH